MMTSSPGSTAVSMAAIIASVAPHETVTSVSGSTSRSHAADCFFATACRSCGAPQVVAYWLYPSRIATAAASMIRGSVSNSGNPWAKLIARSGPLTARFKRVISRMTDSVKLWAFSDRRSVPRIGTLQANVRAGARKTARRHLEPTLPPPAHVARPSRAREEVEHVGPAEEADHLAILDYRHAADALADEQARGFVDAGLLTDGDDVRAHDVARDLALFERDVHLRDDAANVAVLPHHGRAGDVLGRKH